MTINLFSTPLATSTSGNARPNVQAERAAGSDAASEFLKFMEQSPEERMRDLILRSLGITEEQLKALPPEERMKIEAKIAETLREKVREKVEEKAARA